MWRTLPDELVYHILEYLCNDVWSLFNCSLACRRFYYSPICTRRLQKPGNAVRIRGHEDLDFIARAMSSKRSRRFFEQDDITAFIIEDVPQRPLAHVVPLRIAATHVPQVRNIYLRRVNWVTHRPHAAFFLRLAHFDSVTLLELIDCRFSSPDDLRRLTNALPSLVTLRLNSIHCDSSSPWDPIPYGRQSVRELHLRPVGNRPYDESFLAVCRGFSHLTVLIAQIECFGAFHNVRHFVKSFPDITALTLSSGSKDGCDINSYVNGHTDGPLLSPTAAFPLGLVSLCLYEMAPGQMSQVLAWMVRSRSVRTLEYLRIDPAVAQGVLGRAIERVVTMSGDTLNTIRLCIHEPGRYQAFPDNLCAECLCSRPWLLTRCSCPRDR